jgi:hypothetical protein
MAFDLKASSGKVILGVLVAVVVIFLLFPKFKGSSDKYEDEDFAPIDEMYDDYVEDDEGFSERWVYADEGFEGDEGFGPADSTYETVAPLVATQQAIASSRPDLPGVNVATDLLPKPALTQTDFAEFAPQALGAQQLVDATAFIGVNSQGSSLRNANYQLRADIPIPRIDVGPWMASTIEAGDLSRKPLE